MASILSLPFELIDMVVSQFSKKEIFAFSQTCSRLRAFSIGYAYSSIDVTYCPPYSVPEIPADGLLLNLLENPNIRRGVKHIAVRGWMSYSSARERMPRVSARLLTDNEMKTVITHIDALDLPWRKVWITAVGNGDIDAFTALILSALPSVTSVFVDSGSFVRSKFWALLCEHLFSSIQKGLPSYPLCQVQDFQFADPILCCDGISDKEPFLSPLYLPNIQVSDIVIPWTPAEEEIPWLPVQQQFYWSGAPPLASTLTRLSLKHCEAGVDVLFHVLSATPNLQVLVYCHFLDLDSKKPADAHIIDLPALGLALKQVHKTLKELYLKFGPLRFGPINVTEEEEDEREYGIRGEVGSLQEFGQLQVLIIPLIMLLGDTLRPMSEESFLDQLPASTQHLSFRHSADTVISEGQFDTEAFWDRLRVFVQPGRRPPALRSVNLLVPEDLWFGEEDTREFRDICTQGGLYCEIDVDDKL
jgi:hypothetical protein